MSKFEEVIAACKEQVEELGLDVNEELLIKVAKGLGPSIYNADASKVSGADEDEIARVRNNFLINKLGLDDTDELDEAIEEVMEEMGTSNRNKLRVVVYALLVQKFEKEDIYE